MDQEVSPCWVLLLLVLVILACEGLAECLNWDAGGLDEALFRRISGAGLALFLAQSYSQGNSKKVRGINS